MTLRKNYLTQNSKLKKTSKKAGKRVFNWGIPAYRSASGFKTCPKAAACVAGCYAKSGAYRFSNVARAFEERLALSQSVAFVSTMVAEIRRRRADAVRVHDSGDFYSRAYLARWLRVIKACPDVQFYAYTKQVSMFKSVPSLPDNLTIIYSYGGTEDKLIDRETDRHARVFSSLDKLLEAGYANASDNDFVALGDNPKVGLVYHGNKSYENTDWKKVKGE